MLLRQVLFLILFFPVGMLSGATRGMAQSMPDGCMLVRPTVPGLLVAVGSPLPTRFVSAQMEGGAPARVSVNCTQSVGFQVGLPMQMSGPSFTPSSVWSRVTARTMGGQVMSVMQGQSLLIPANTMGVFDIDIAVDGDRAVLVAGTYEYTVLFTITP